MHYINPTLKKNKTSDYIQSASLFPAFISHAYQGLAGLEEVLRFPHSVVFKYVNKTCFQQMTWYHYTHVALKLVVFVGPEIKNEPNILARSDVHIIAIAILNVAT